MVSHGTALHRLHEEQQCLLDTSFDDKKHGDVDVSIATEHLCLAATERGLGTCWVCNYDISVMKELFPSDDFETVAIIPIGHVAADCPHAEKKRKPMAEIVEEI